MRTARRDHARGARPGGGRRRLVAAWAAETNDGFYAAGDHCQFVYVHRPSRTVITRVGSACGDTDWPAALGDLARWLAEPGGGR